MACARRSAEAPSAPSPTRRGRRAARRSRLPVRGSRELGEVPVQLLDVLEELRDLPPARAGIVAGELEDRECDPPTEGAPSKSACLDDAEQLGDRSARLLGLTPVGVDLGNDRQAKRLEDLQPDLA